MLRIAELPIRHRVVEDEAATADQMPRRAVVDRTVVAEEVIETAGRIEHVRRVEAQRVLDVRQQEAALAETCNGRHGYRCVRGRGGLKRVGLRHGLFTEVLARVIRWTGKRISSSGGVSASSSS